MKIRHWMIASTVLSVVVLTMLGCNVQGSADIQFKTPTPTTLASPAALAATATAVPRTPVATATPVPPTLTATASVPTPVPTPNGANEVKVSLAAELQTFIELQLGGKPKLGPARVFIVEKSQANAEADYLLQLNAHEWKQVATNVDPITRTKMIVMEKGNTRLYLVFVTQASSETLVYIVMTQK